MECFLIDFKGNSFELPIIIEWSFTHGLGIPCDCFEISFLYDKSMAGILENALRFKAVHEGETVFFGVVDEFEISISCKGSLAAVRGRGLSALLLDNEVEAAQYFSAGLELILDRYVYAFGINQVKVNVNPKNMALTVASGASAYRVLEDFLWFGASAKPHFSKDGVLILGDGSGRRLAVGKDCAVSAYEMKRRRYGVISEVLVRNKVLGNVATVRNESFFEKGGRCRRVINVPRNTRFDAMRMTGEYQIRASEEKALAIKLFLPSLFAAFPEDIIELTDSPLGADGVYKVGESCCFGNEKEAGTLITLTKREA
jgi:hypothetical protein